MFDFRKLPSATAFAMWPKRPYYTVLRSTLRLYTASYVRCFICLFICSSACSLVCCFIQNIKPNSFSLLLLLLHLILLFLLLVFIVLRWLLCATKNSGTATKFNVKFYLFLFQSSLSFHSQWKVHLICHRIIFGKWSCAQHFAIVSNFLQR